MLFRYIFILLIVFITAGCSDKKPKVQEVLALQQMSDLATVEYVVTKIIKANDNKTWYKIGDRKILMSCKAQLIAGIDMSLIKEENISINEKEIHLTLPHSKLIATNIKPEDIKLEYEEVAAFRQHYSAAERDAMSVQAEKQINSSVEALGILQTAETNASLFVTNFLHRLGYEKVTITFGESATIKNQ